MQTYSPMIRPRAAPASPALLALQPSAFHGAAHNAFRSPSLTHAAAATGFSMMSVSAFSLSGGVVMAHQISPHAAAYPAFQLPPPQFASPVVLPAARRLWDDRQPRADVDGNDDVFSHQFKQEAEEEQSDPDSEPAMFMRVLSRANTPAVKDEREAQEMDCTTDLQPALIVDSKTKAKGKGKKAARPQLTVSTPSYVAQGREAHQPPPPMLRAQSDNVSNAVCSPPDRGSYSRSDSVCPRGSLAKFRLPPPCLPPLDLSAPAVKVEDGPFAYNPFLVSLAPSTPVPGGSWAVLGRQKELQATLIEHFDLLDDTRETILARARTLAARNGLNRDHLDQLVDNIRRKFSDARNELTQMFLKSAERCSAGSKMVDLSLPTVFEAPSKRRLPVAAAAAVTVSLDDAADAEVAAHATLASKRGQAVLSPPMPLLESVQASDQSVDSDRSTVEHRILISPPMLLGSLFESTARTPPPSEARRRRDDIQSCGAKIDSTVVKREVKAELMDLDEEAKRPPAHPRKALRSQSVQFVAKKSVCRKLRFESRCETPFSRQDPANAPLAEWLSAHLADPYPNVEEKERLVQITGKTWQQAWFTNNRGRAFGPAIKKEQAAMRKKFKLTDGKASPPKIAHCDTENKEDDESTEADHSQPTSVQLAPAGWQGEVAPRHCSPLHASAIVAAAALSESMSDVAVGCAPAVASVSIESHNQQLQAQPLIQEPTQQAKSNPSAASKEKAKKKRKKCY